jgi:dihydroorotate dehydrogenase electron transfer subunit
MRDGRAVINDELCRVKSNEAVTPILRRLEFESGMARGARAGQFVMAFPPRDSMLLGRPFAIAERSEGSFALWYMTIGRGTRAMAGLAPGDAVRVRGPIGNWFPDPPPGARLWAAMGAVGAAALTLTFGADAEFMLGVPDASWRPFVDMLAAKMKSAGGELRVFSDDGSLGERGNALSGLPDELPPGDVVWACGTNAMSKALAMKYPKQRSQAFVSMDAKMACGYGGCMGCVIDTVRGKKRSCADGPVFGCDEVNWDAFD